MIVEQTTVTALGHDFTGDYTYDAAGHWHVCARDNCEVTDTKAAHTYNTTDCEQAATCACGYEKPAGEHTWGAWTKVDDTNHTHTCGSCQTSETAAHSWGDGVVTVEPTEDTEGVRTFTCSDCSATKTEAEPVKPAATLVLEADTNDANHKLSIDFTKEDKYDGYALYYYDSEGNEVGYSMMYDGINLLVAMPYATTSGKYTLVVRGFVTGANATEVVRLTDCIEVTVAGDAVEYTMESTSEGATTTLTAGPETGIWLYEAWFRDGRATGYNSGMNSYYGDSFPKSPTTHTIGEYQLADGDVYDVRVLTSVELAEQIVKVTMTPASTKTYTAPTE